MNNLKKRLGLSLLSLLLCISTFAGTTFAWFTDNESTGNNIITSGNLDIEMYWTDALKGDQTVWTNVEDSDTGIFVSDNWEPGRTEIKYLKVVNNGNLSLKYQISLLPMGEVGILADVIDVYYAQLEKGTTTSPFATRLDVTQHMIKSDLVLTDMVNNGTPLKMDGEVLLPKNVQDSTYESGESIIAIALHMQETAGNQYQQQSLGDGFGIQAIATQFGYESDGFGNDYDNDVLFPNTFMPISVSKNVSELMNAEFKLNEQVIINGPYGVKVTVDAETKLDGSGLLTLIIKEKENSEANVKVGENEQLKAFDVHVEGLADDNTKPMAIEMGKVLPAGLNKGNLAIYHVENNNSNKMEEVSTKANLSKHNQFVYEPIDGSLTLYMSSFSEVALVADGKKGWEGNRDYSWYDSNKEELIIANADQLAAFGAIVGGMGKYENGDKIPIDSFSGKTVKLISNINLGDDEENNNPDIIFYPIGYWNSEGKYERESGGSVESTVYSFEGTFDGKGHTISNFYQNTWEMFGDYNSGYSGTPNYYKDAMGLFGYVVNGIVKNLTVHNFSSDGEFTPTGVIAAYAVNSTFENIAITNCNPRVYNTGNGGIIGIAGRENADLTESITLKNVTVDNSNKISALWGSWDVACGGLVGMYRGNADNSNDTIYFENCHVSAIIDVYNDVCANYQYYAYRYAGMIIGSVRHNVTENGKTLPNMNGISAKECTVNFGNWNDYYYCEFEKNSMASYSEDYQFSRVDRSEIIFDKDGNAIGCTHTHTEAEDKRAVYLPFHQLFTGYSWGVSSVGLNQYTGILDVSLGTQEESVTKFEGKVTELVNNADIKIGEIFKFKDSGVELKPSSLVVTVTSKDENNPISATFVPDNQNWENGTLRITGTGEAEITIQDYYFCTPTTIDVNIKDRQKGNVYISKLTGNFLYRVGNFNIISLSDLVEPESSFNIQADSTDVSITTHIGNASGQFTPNVNDWDGTIQFSGTGVVKVVVNNSKDTFCIPTELYLEVVDGKNIVSKDKKYLTQGDGNKVLLCDASLGSTKTIYLNNQTLYGNGFTIDCTEAPYKGTGSVSENFIVGLMNGHLDNVILKGKVYSTYGASANDSYNRALVVSKGNSSITNSYISNTASPVRLVEGNLEVKGTTLKGGNFANLDVRNGHLIIDDITTINQASLNDLSDDGTEVVGLGVVVYYENVDSNLTSITVKNKITQYNCISKNQKFTHSYAEKLRDQALTYTDLIFTANNGVPWVNTGILSMSDNINVNIPNGLGYETKEVSLSGQSGDIYTRIPNELDIKQSSYEYKTLGQGVIIPQWSFDYTKENYIPKTEGSNDYCYYENGKVLISMDQGDTFEWNPYILTSSKYGNVLNYSVSMSGKEYSSNEKILFNTAGEYVVTYTITDPYNYIQNNQMISAKDYVYVETVNISVTTVKVTTKHAKFTFADTNTATEKLTINDKTYISAKGVTQTDKEWGYITVNGTKVYYPITEAQFKKATFKSEYQVFYYVFKDAITITDYNDGGTGTEFYYNQSTTSKPSSLNVVNGMEAKYTSINSACVDISKLTKDGPSGEVWDFSSSSTVSGTTTYNGYLAHSSPSGLAIKSGTRDYDAITVAQFSYTDSSGATYYYFVGYFMPNQTSSSSGGSSGGGCFTSETLITLADGTQKEIQYINYEDELLVWDFYTGKYTASVPSLIESHEESEVQVITLKFADGTVVNVANDHGFFDKQENNFVYIDEKNVANYVGHEFIKVDDNDSYKSVKLIDYTIDNKKTAYYTIQTAIYNNCIAENMFTLTSPPELLTNDKWFDYFEIGNNMKYNEAKMMADISKYGLYSYDDFAEYVTYEEFIAFNGPYLKVLVGKGYVTLEEILELIPLFVTNN